jgi:zinc/manganese transport system substrate-binding protein/manganese/iron transport system substrate-binding protein
MSALLLILSTVAATGCGAPTGSEPTGEPLRVVASTTVFADLVQQVGGDDVSVTSLVPKGGVVETFDPTPSTLRLVADADLIVMNGLGLDEWLRPLIDDSGATAPVLELAPDLDGVDYVAGDEPDSEAINPHLWLDVRYAMKYVERIIDRLATLDPSRAQPIRDRGAVYLARLADLDASTRERIDAIPASDRLIVSFHEAFPYFAAAYGLTIVGTIVDAPGQDPSAGEIADLVAAIRSSGAKAVFGEAQFSPALAETIAGEADVAVETDLYNDSLGDPPVDTYEGLIRWDVDRVVAALGG